MGYDLDEMIANHIHDALAQVRKVQEYVLEKRFFKGYSGPARIISGLGALAGAAVLDSGEVPAIPNAHLIGWGIILTLALVLNYGALAYWFLFNPVVQRDFRQAKPAIDAIPALVVGAVLSVAVILAGQYDLLLGIWMCLYGLAQVAYRLSLPRPIYIIGLGYILFGAFCLATQVSFLNPWPMGIAFCAGETIGGIVLHGSNRFEKQFNKK